MAAVRETAVCPPLYQLYRRPHGGGTFSHAAALRNKQRPETQRCNKRNKN